MTNTTAQFFAPLLALLWACEPPAELTPVGPLGSALGKLDAATQARLPAGEALFNRVFTPEQGLGPLFNDNQCSACHTKPATGGTGDQFVQRQSRFDGAAGCDVLSSAGGENVRINATPALRAHGIERQPIPEKATEKTRFNVPFIFGLGLIDAVPEQQIAERADPQDHNQDGISGRPGKDSQGRFARFGRKADHATLRAFVENAAHFEMGLTTPQHPTEGNLAGRPFPAGVDPAPELELSEAEVALITDFVRFLSPPAQQLGVAEEDRKDILRGEELFHSTGCTGCHTPSMTTGPHDIAALSRKRFFLYSDLLLHDLGPELVTVCAPGASPWELRTEPLMGLGRRSRFLHDSRTNDLTEAIGAHGGEAARARARFQSLGELQQHKLIRFLQSL